MIYDGKKEEARLSIDLTGPQGNAFYLLAAVRDLGKQLGITKEEVEKIQEEMRSSDYENLISVFDSHFGKYVDLYRGNEDEDDEEDLDWDYDEEEDEEDD